MEASVRPATVTIEKEEIPFLSFPKEEVLSDPYEREMRKADVRQAMRLGNLERHKVTIVFEDIEGTKQVNTTIWGVTKKNVLLKGRISIPGHCIHRIKLL